MRNGTLRAVAIGTSLAVALIAVIAAVLWWKYNDIITQAGLSVARPSVSKETAPLVDRPAASAPAATTVTKETVTAAKEGTETVTTVKTVTTETTTTTRPARAEAKKGTAEKPKETPKKKVPAKPRAQQPTVRSPGVSAAKSEWLHWGADPHADSFAEACRNMPRDIDSSSMPEGAKIKLKQRIAPNCENWTETYVPPNMQLAEMWSGKYGKEKPPRIMPAPLVAAIPVAIGPDGRHYRQGSVFQTARAAMWQVEHEGKTYYWYIMFACFNSAWRMVPVVIGEPAELCASVQYTVRPGTAVWFKVYAARTFRAHSRCWTLNDGGIESAHPTPCFNCKERPGILERVTPGFHVVHTGIYIARNSTQTLYFPLDITNADLLLCAMENNVQSQGALIHKEVWHTERGATRIAIIVNEKDYPIYDEDDLVGRTILRGEEVR